MEKVVITQKSSGRASIWRRMLNNPGIPIYFILLICWIIGTSLSESFRSPANFPNLMVQTVAFALAGLAQTFAILAGDTNLGVGGIMSIVVCGLPLIMVDNPASMIGMSLVLLLAGTLIGALSGYLVNKIKVEAMVLTLAINFTLLGFALYLMPFPDYTKIVPVNFIRAMTGSLKFILPIIGQCEISFPVFGTIIIALISWYVLYLTRFGLHLRAVGADKETAFRAGINVDRIKIMAHAICGLLSALAGLFLAGRMGTGDPTAGASFSLDSMTAAVAGGTLFSTGVGSVAGTLGGAFLIVILGNIFNHLGVSTFYQYVFRGALLVVAVAGGAIKKKWQDAVK